LTWVQGDLDDERSLRALVSGADAIVHCAGTVRGADAASFERINADGTRRLVDAAATLPDAPRFLLMSSLAARTPQLSPYAASKRHGEAAVEAAPLQPAVDGAAPAGGLWARRPGAPALVPFGRAGYCASCRRAAPGAFR
jgi:uncharacterized protein YbjT (DUF2867 family)